MITPQPEIPRWPDSTNRASEMDAMDAMRFRKIFGMAFVGDVSDGSRAIMLMRKFCHESSPEQLKKKFPILTESPTFSLDHFRRYIDDQP